MKAADVVLPREASLSRPARGIAPPAGSESHGSRIRARPSNGRCGALESTAVECTQRTKAEALREDSSRQALRALAGRPLKGPTRFGVPRFYCDCTGPELPST